MEYETDKFARAILLPKNKFKAEVRKNGNVKYLAKLFKVATFIIHRRAKELGLKAKYFERKLLW